ncbi:MAG: hypothetical protein GY679_03130 [Mycoplasma sp.]|nr:hypothetical protein [Mycoplasma sp.]
MKNKAKFKITILDIVHISIILSLYLTSEFLNGIWNMDVLPGIKIQITPIIIIICSFVLGPWKTGSAISIFVFIIAWTNPKAFISGVTWVKTPKLIFGEYMLDYVLPLFSISFIPGLYKYLKPKHSYFITLSIALFFKFISHVCAGILFWGGYAQDAFGNSWKGYILGYAILANLLGMSFIIPATYLLAWPSVNKIKLLILEGANRF